MNDCVNILFTSPVHNNYNSNNGKIIIIINNYILSLLLLIDFSFITVIHSLTILLEKMNI